MKREQDRRLAIDPFGQTLQKNSAGGEKDTGAQAIHRIREASPKKACAHAEPTRPKEREYEESGDAQLARSDHAEIVRGRGILGGPVENLRAVEDRRWNVVVILIDRGRIEPSAVGF